MKTDKSVICVNPKFVKDLINRSLLHSLEVNSISLDDSGEVDYSKCRDKAMIQRLKSKNHIVKEALQWKDLDFGNVHRQKQEYKAIQLNAEIRGAYQTERVELGRLQNIMKSISQHKEDAIEKSLADELIGSRFHAFRQKIIDDEDDAIDQANMDIENFLDGKPLLEVVGTEIWA